jgi:hypothetical protein
MLQTFHILHRPIPACGDQRTSAPSRIDLTVYGKEVGIWIRRDWPKRAELMIEKVIRV